MKKFKAAPGVLMCIWLLTNIFSVNIMPAAASVSLGDWGTPEPSDKREWTILIYMDGDNNLEFQALYHMRNLEQGLAEAKGKVDVAVLLDRAQGFEAGLGDWTGARAYHIRPSKGPDAPEGELRELNSELLADCGELDMASPATLEAFIRAGLEKYPAPKVALVLWNHGGTWIGLLDDQDDGKGNQTLMSLEQFQGVLSRVSGLFPGGRADLLVFEMCLMGQAEVAAACAPFARYMLAAPTPVSALGMDYVSALSLFARGDKTDRLAVNLLKNGTRGLSYRKDWSITACDLSRADEMTAAFGALAKALSGRMSEEWDAVTRTAFYTQNYGGRSDYTAGRGAFSSVDALDWLARMKETLKNPPLKEIEAAEAAIKSMILATENGPGFPGGRGLSIYVPLREDNVIPRYEDTDFNQKTGWLTALSNLHKFQKKEGMEAPEVTEVEFGNPVLKAGVKTVKSGADLSITPSDSVVPLSGRDADNGSWVRLVIEGKYILWAQMGMSMSDSGDPNGEYTTLTRSILMDEALDPESLQKRAEAASDEILTPVFKDGRNELAYQVGGMAHRFSNGEKSVLVTAEFLDLSDSKHFIVRGTYSDSETNGELPVEVKVNTEFYSIESMTAVVPGEWEGSTTFAVTPIPGGVFRPTLEKRTGDGEVRKVPGEELVWKEGVSVILELIPEGRYMKIAGMAESLGGTGAERMSRPVAVKANPNITPWLEVTNREGLAKLPGRYAVAAGVPRRDDETLIIAPTGSVLEIKLGPYPNGGENLIAIQQTPGEEDMTFYLNWEQEGVPFLSRFQWNDSWKGFSLADRNFAVLVTDETGYVWKMFDAFNLSPVVLVPISDQLFSARVLEGTWTGKDNSSFIFSGGRFEYRSATGKNLAGRYAVRDSLVMVTPDGQQSALPGFAFIPEGDSLVLTFLDSGKSMIYDRAEQQKPVIRPRPSAPPQPPVPQQVSLDGVWGAMVNGQQWVMQYQGNRYQGWINGMPAEAGIFQIQGNMMVGQTTTGMAFSNFFQMAPDGSMFQITAPNGFSIVYQRMQ
ncbi:MAG: hypothetical protein LBR61_09960 [Synergistaceae bacterium]|nr:hypothetical protein [Synergistaceae bacterium]